MKKTVREWMQTEIWSKRTTKKIAVSIVVIVIVLISLEFFYDRWLNPWERDAAKVVFEHAVAVRKANADDLKNEVEKAKASEDLAEIRVWTLRDRLVELEASNLVVAAEICRKYEVLPNPSIASDDSDKQKKYDESSAQMGRTMCDLYEISEVDTRHLLNTRLGF